MKKLTYIIAFCLGVALTCLCNHISLIKPASAENPGKQAMLRQMAWKIAVSCADWMDMKDGTACADYYEFYQKHGGTDEAIYYEFANLQKK